LGWSELELYCGVASCGTRKVKCGCCGKVVQLPTSYNKIVSDFDNKEFCSYNCKMKYYNDHEQEREDYFAKKNDKKHYVRNDKHNAEALRRHREKKLKRKTVEQVDFTGITEIECYRMWDDKLLRVDFDWVKYKDREVRFEKKEGSKIILYISAKKINKGAN